ncbi:MAG TPA: hypothetical protein VF629_11390 [Hymenobacter sp.]|jgi:hypothetical protein|uniref:hypothetical protein n=1 Tax=Hymenobacter sp. TaxID=1898978 RepID=UPI002EDB1540
MLTPALLARTPQCGRIRRHAHYRTISIQTVLHKLLKQVLATLPTWGCKQICNSTEKLSAAAREGLSNYAIFVAGYKKWARRAKSAWLNPAL